MGKFRICLDAGHYTNYNKGVIKGYYEGNEMFKLTQYEAELFEEYENVEVVTTKNKLADNPSLSERGKMAKDFNLFLSNHSNADDGSGKAKGVTVLDSVTRPNKSIAETIGKAVAKTMNTNLRQVVYRKNSRGTDYYGVLRASSSANCKVCLLVEHGFHTNKSECAFLFNDDNLKKIAKAKVEVIAQIFGLKKREEKKRYYRVRKSWADAKSQLGAYVSLESAKSVADKNEGFNVYDEDGKLVHAGVNPAVKGEPEVDYYVVEADDTLWGIAHEFSMTVDELKQLNGLKDNIIHIGDKLRLNSGVKPEPKPQEKLTGDSVIRGVQTTLNSRYDLKVDVDGYYGNETKTAIIKGLQSELNRQYGEKLAVDGKFGSKSRNAWHTIKKGAKGNITYLIQALLYVKGYKLDLDGSFGGATDNVVRQFQKDNKLTQDGKVGKNSICELID